MSATATKPKQMTEKEVQAGLIAAAKTLGYSVYHTTYSIGSEPGFPDLHILGHGRQFVFEIKGPRGAVSSAQNQWIARYQIAGVTAWVVWPKDYDTALELLQEGATHADD